MAGRSAIGRVVGFFRETDADTARVVHQLVNEVMAERRKVSGNGGGAPFKRRGRGPNKPKPPMLPVTSGTPDQKGTD